MDRPRSSLGCANYFMFKVFVRPILSKEIYGNITALSLLKNQEKDSVFGSAPACRVRQNAQLADQKLPIQHTDAAIIPLDGLKHGPIF
ncbi:hypothetical protein [Rhizobium sp. RU36D]|uniref:hypothetical protein n=1 Tax=Rhizobium sp. RU36D TaxID=1907415 RepID=UPI000A007A64|nr:hypothetical protein [Rhizobium sp. RU36D]